MTLISSVTELLMENTMKKQESFRVDRKESAVINFCFVVFYSHDPYFSKDEIL